MKNCDLVNIRNTFLMDVFAAWENLQITVSLNGNRFKFFS
jgi:hypothetical protein